MRILTPVMNTLYLTPTTQKAGHQKISITLQRIPASSILIQVIAVGLAPSRLRPLQDTPPSPRLAYCRRLIFDMDKYGQPITGDQSLTWRDFDI
jgi:hypothetical protein